jgi:hypothetical protein
VNKYLTNLGIDQIDDLGDDFSDETYDDDDIAKLLSSANKDHKDGRSFRELCEAEYGSDLSLTQESSSLDGKHEFFDRGEINEVIDTTIRAQDSISLAESVYTYNSLSDDEQKRLYDIFRDSYQKATGAAFDQDDFDWRASNWTFFGNAPDDKNPTGPVGGIAVRKQMSNNMIKLVASFGDFRSVLRGFDEFKSKHGNDPTWGIVTPEILKLVTKHDKNFKALPGIVVKAMETAIKKFSNGEVKSVGIDGSMQVSTPAGIMKKMFLANIPYLRWLIDSVENPDNASRLPVPQIVLSPLIGLIKKVVGISN